MSKVAEYFFFGEKLIIFLFFYIAVLKFCACCQIFKTRNKLGVYMQRKFLKLYIMIYFAKENFS